MEKRFELLNRELRFLMADKRKFDVKFINKEYKKKIDLLRIFSQYLGTFSIYIL